MKMEKLLNTDDKPFSVFLRYRDHYFSNAQEMIRKDEIRKASEMLWGAAVQSIKFLASINSVTLRSHKNIRDFVREVSEEEKNEALYQLFLELESLHRYFYDEDIMEKGDFPIFYEKVTQFLKKMDGI